MLMWTPATVRSPWVQTSRTVGCVSTDLRNGAVPGRGIGVSRVILRFAVAENSGRPGERSQTMLDHRRRAYAIRYLQIALRAVQDLRIVQAFWIIRAEINGRRVSEAIYRCTVEGQGVGSRGPLFSAPTTLGTGHNKYFFFCLFNEKLTRRKTINRARTPTPITPPIIPPARALTFAPLDAAALGVSSGELEKVLEVMVGSTAARGPSGELVVGWASSPPD